ncbi:MAG: hypothetical protein Roseis2KO_57110 [Roseivirga sp.]
MQSGTEYKVTTSSFGVIAQQDAEMNRPGFITLSVLMGERSRSDQYLQKHKIGLTDIQYV